MSKWISGQRAPGVPTLRRVGACLGLPEAAILRVAGHREEAERLAGADGPPLSIAAAVERVRVDLGMVPMWPTVRAATTNLIDAIAHSTVAELTAVKAEKDAWRVRAERAANRALGPVAARKGRLSVAEIHAIITGDFLRYLLEETDSHEATGR